MNEGKLYLIPVGLGSENPQEHLPQHNLDIVSQLDEFIVENVRSARRFLRATSYTKDFDEVTFHVLDKHTSDNEIPSFLTGIQAGKDIGLLSEAGNPCIADPGGKVVKLAHEQKIEVIPMVGPSSILLSLIASGFNGQNFCFHGYLPVEKRERQKKIKALQQDAYQKDQTQIFMETPYRNDALLEDLLTICNDNTLLCIAADISLPDQFIKTRTIREWKKNKPGLHKRPSVFLIYKD